MVRRMSLPLPVFNRGLAKADRDRQSRGNDSEQLPGRI